MSSRSCRAMLLLAESSLMLVSGTIAEHTLQEAVQESISLRRMLHSDPAAGFKCTQPAELVG